MFNLPDSHLSKRLLSNKRKLSSLQRLTMYHEFQKVTESNGQCVFVDQYTARCLKRLMHLTQMIWGSIFEHLQISHLLFCIHRFYILCFESIALHPLFQIFCFEPLSFQLSASELHWSAHLEFVELLSLIASLEIRVSEKIKLHCYN